MNIRFSFLVATLALTAPLAQAWPIKDSDQEMTQATQAAVTIYRNHGTLPLQKNIADCYKEVGYATPFCVYMDAAGREIEFNIARSYKELGQNVPPQAFFQRQAFGERTASFYILHRSTRSEANDHMRKIQPKIQKMVAKLLAP